MATQEEGEIAVFGTTQLTSTGILREAVKIPARNGKFTLQVILLILFPFFLLVLLHNLLARPLINKVEDSYEQDQSSLDLKHVKSLLGLELLFVVAFSIFSFYGILLTIQASTSIYLGKNIRFYALILWFKLSWKNPLITWLYISFFTFIYLALIIVIVKLVSLIFWVVGMVFYLYLASQWILALVVSVMEDEFYGIKAIRRARKLIAGRQVQGLFLMFILFAISCPIYVLFYVIVVDDDDELGPFTQFAFGLIVTLLFGLAKFFTWIVFSVFYFECKISHGEEVELELEARCSLVSCEVGLH